MDRVYAAIDLKSYYASAECVSRGLDPMTTNLVVADASRTEKTICLAVTPSLKAFGIPGRARLFEVVQKVREVNAKRLYRAPGRKFTGSSTDAEALASDPGLALDYIAAPPRMALYMEYSTRIYQVYLKYVAPEDIHVYSIDEVFIDVTRYLPVYGLTARELTKNMLQDVLKQTGITAAAGIGTNLYLCKVAMDITAKHVEPDADGARIAELDELSYRETLWDHRPLTDFWRVGRGYAAKLEASGIRTMGDVARCSLGRDRDLLYKLFGVNAELLIDHAWGYEPCTIADIKGYRPESSSLCSGQVLQSPYTAEKARLVLREMTDLLVLDLADKGLVTDQMVLTVGYDIENVTGGMYHGPVTRDPYGRLIPKHAHGSINLGGHTLSTRRILEAVTGLYDRIVDPNLLIRRLNITANHIVSESAALQAAPPEQLDLFTDQQEKAREQVALARERAVQQAVLTIKKRFGKNAILKGMNLEKGATARERNRQIGGHKA